MQEITNKDLLEQIADNKVAVEQIRQDVESLRDNTKDMVAAFNAAKGAFAVLEWLAKIAKPLMVITSAIGAAYLWSKGYRG